MWRVIQPIASSFCRLSWNVRSLYALWVAVTRPLAEHQRTRPVAQVAHLWRTVMVSSIEGVISPSIICWTRTLGMRTSISKLRLVLLIVCALLRLCLSFRAVGRRAGLPIWEQVAQTVV